MSVFGSGDYDRKKKLQSSVWRVVLLCQFLVLAITTGKKKLQSSVWRVVLLCQFLVLAGNRQFFCVAGKFYSDWKNKSSSRLSGGLCCCGSGDYDRKKKFQSSVWRASCDFYAKLNVSNLNVTNLY